MLTPDKYEVRYYFNRYKRAGKSHVNLSFNWEDAVDFKQLLAAEGYKFKFPKEIPDFCVPYVAIEIPQGN